MRASPAWSSALRRSQSARRRRRRRPAARGGHRGRGRASLAAEARAAEPRLAHRDARAAAARHAEGRGDARRQDRRSSTAPRSGSPARRRAGRRTGCARSRTRSWSGSTTALRDDPALTVRLRRAVATRAVPRRARHAAPGSPPEARADPRRHAGARAHRRGRGGAAAARWRALEAAGATRGALPDAGRPRRRQRACSTRLFEREVRAVLVEGGGEVHAAFLDAGLVDRVALVPRAAAARRPRGAPASIGGAGPRAQERAAARRRRR